MEQTHDSLYKLFIAQQFGPNYLPSIKLFSVIIAFGFLVIILLSNLHIASIPTQCKEETFIQPTLSKITVVP